MVDSSISTYRWSFTMQEITNRQYMNYVKRKYSNIYWLIFVNNITLSSKNLKNIQAFIYLLMDRLPLVSTG